TEGDPERPGRRVVAERLGERLPGRVSRVARRIVPVEVAPDRGMDAVGADEDVAPGGVAVREPDRDAVPVLGYARHLLAKRDTAVAELGGKHRLKLRADDADRRLAEPPLELGHVERAEDAGARVPELGPAQHRGRI